MYNYRATIIKVVDGDTIHLEIDLGFDIRQKTTVRLFGINTPELRGDNKEGGAKAKERVKELLPEGTIVRITTEKDRKEKYGRYLAIIYLNTSASEYDTINNLLIGEGLAERYV